MKQIWKKRAVVLGCILLAAGVLVSGASFAAMGFSLRTFSSPREQAAEPETYSFTGDEVAAVDIESSFRRIQVEGVPGLKAPELTISPDVFEYQLEAGAGGPTVVVRETEEAKSGGWRWFQLFTFHSDDQAEAILRLPEDFSGSLRLQSSFGGVRVKNLSRLENLAVGSENESVRLETVEASEKIEVTSSFGSVKAANSAAKSFSCRNANGDVSLSGCSAEEAELSTEFGVLRVEDGTFGTLALENSNGDTKLTDVKASGSLQHRSHFGALSFSGLESPSLTLRAENGDIRGTLVGSEQEYKISSSVKYGDSNLQNRMEGKNTLEVESEFGSVRIDFTED